MKKTTLKQWIATYLRINKTITYVEASELYGCTYSCFTGRISELRGNNWRISQEDGVYKLELEPDVDLDGVDIKAEIDEIVSLLRIASESLEQLAP